MPSPGLLTETELKFSKRGLVKSFRLVTPRLAASTKFGELLLSSVFSCNSLFTFFPEIIFHILYSPINPFILKNLLQVILGRIVRYEFQITTFVIPFREEINAFTRLNQVSHKIRHPFLRIVQ